MPDSRLTINQTLHPLVTDRWACPACQRRSLGAGDSAVTCAGCGAAFPLEHGIPLFASDPIKRTPSQVDLSIVVLALNERGNVATLLARLKESLAGLKISTEIF